MSVAGPYTNGREEASKIRMQHNQQQIYQGRCTMAHSNRREFLKSSAAAGASLLAAPAIARSAQSANDRIRVGLVGLGGRMHSTSPAWRQWPRKATWRSPPSAIATRRSWTGRRRPTPSWPGKKLTVYHRSAETVRRQVDRRRELCHAGPLARLANHLGLPGGQGRLRGEARHA